MWNKVVFYFVDNQKFEFHQNVDCSSNNLFKTFYLHISKMQIYISL